MEGKDLIEKEEKLAVYQGDDKVISSLELDKVLGQDQTPEVKIMSKMPRLDKLIDGFEGGELIVISGKPKSGKTLLSQTFTVNFLKDEVLSLWFTYEVTPKQFLKRFSYTLDGLPLFYLPKKHKPKMIEWIRNRIWEAKIKYNIQVVFIDHLHFIIDMTKSRNPSIDIGVVIRQLKQMAIEFNIVIFLLCHLQKVSKDKEPTAEDIRDSSFLTQESDTTLILYRLKDNKSKGILNQAVLVVEMTRRSGCLSKKVRMIKGKGLLYELEGNIEGEEKNEEF